MSSADFSEVPVERRVRVLINPRSGIRSVGLSLFKAFERHWNGPAVDLSYQISDSIADGCAKARRAVADGVGTIVVVGGDGMVNTIGSELVGTNVALGVIPAGSGNGFARHFGIPLEWESAVRALARAETRAIDVGTANGRPFFVTCSMAWDASIASIFERFHVRGILPYLMAGAYGLLEYRPAPFEIEIDGGLPETVQNPMVFTVANLTQFGGGARIAPEACADDGRLELVIVQQADAARAAAQFARLYDGTLSTVPGVQTRRFGRSLVVRRLRPAPIQLDGEAVDSPTEVLVRVLPAALRVLVPTAAP
jgi:diacylglycerol kinase (ATP)